MQITLLRPPSIASRMWSQISLCLLVGLAFASNQGWQDNTEYVYEVRGRTLSSLHEVANDFSGVFMKAKLIIRPKSDGNLDAKIKDAQYAEIHAPLQDGWETYVPDSQLEYQSIPVSDKPFRIVTKNGAIRDLVVSKDINNWEANFIKSIVSQYQLDLQGENVIASHINTLTQDDRNTAVFKTMEETVTGVAETLYEIHPLPEYSIQTKPWMVPKPELKGENGDYIEIIKSKNFTHSKEMRSYHYGFKELNFVHPSGNKMGDYMSRTSVSRAIITGDLNSYVVQSTITVDQITIAPTFNDKQRGSVNTLLNMTLLSVQAASGEILQIPNEINLGTIVYGYDDPFSVSNEPRKGRGYQHSTPDASYESRSEKNEPAPWPPASRFRRDAASNDIYKISFSSSDERDSSEESDQYWQQDKAELEKAPKSPLLPYTVGYDGQSLKKRQNVIEEVRKLAQRIGQEIQRPDKMPEKNTISKFVTLSSLLRIMDKSEMQKAGEELYTEEQTGQTASAWKIYRDAVAEAGTGPALLTIKEWIQSKKIKSQEDAQIIQALADSTRQPTEEYMRTFYQLVTSPEVMQHPHLNTSGLLAYSKLVHEVYINVPISHSKFPENSFGRFWTKAGKKFVKNEVIPYLTEKLHLAVSEGDTEKIHVYIRALGNIGHRRMLEAFEPYLEGEKQASQFQRVLMVVAFDKLVYTYPNVARSVLYKIYQNPSDYDQVRVAAVYQLMRTNPSPSMLQRLASYTNADPSEYVNSAVKSSIESAAELKGSEHSELRRAAESAQHLLTEKKYGAQYSHNQLRSYVIEEMRLKYKQSIHTYGHDDNILPEGAHYHLRGRFGGLRQHIVDIQAFVSSVDDLVNVFQQQTEQYQKQKQRKDAENSESQKWSSEYIAKMLNMEVKQREQLEGNFFVQMGQLQKMASFDNKTIEMLPKVLQEFEEVMTSGKKFSLQKMINDQEIAVAFPTATGFPFIYTYDRPTFVSIEGKARANAEPQISSENKFREPKRVKGDFEIRVHVSGKTQSQLGFITPFDHKRYYAGYDKNFQVHVPVSGSVDIDIENLQAKVEIEGLASQQQQYTQLAHYSSWPYTSHEKIYEVEPKHHQIISKEHPQRFHTVFGDKAIGVGVNLEVTSDERIDMGWAYRKLQKHDPISALLSPWLDENIQHVKMDLHINREQCTTKKAVFRFGAQHKYQTGRTDQAARDTKPQISKFSEISEEPLKRQSEFAKRAGQGINNVHSRVYYGSAEFEGDQKIKYTGTFAQSKSNVDSNGRILAHFDRKGGEKRPIYFALSAKGKFANTNGLNFQEAMQLDTTSNIEVEAAYGDSYEKSTKINTRGKHSRSEERTKYLMEHPETKECLRQMQEGNNQLPACAKMTASANLLDKFDYKFDYENLQPELVNATYKLYKAIEYHVFYPNIDVNIVSAGNGKDSVEIEGRFDTDLKSANATFIGKAFRGRVQNIPVNEWAQRVLVPHPVFHIRSRLYGKAFNYQVYRPFCVVDKTATTTFDNKTYPVTLSNDWTVLLQYVPHRPSPKEKHPIHDAKQQLKQQIETYSVLSRASQQSQNEKEIKITLQTPYTRQKVVEINLKSSGSQQYPKLLVNGEEIKYSTEQAADIFEGYIQAYGLPKKEIKVEIFKAFYIIYDGQRAKITIVDQKFRGAVQGLCGTFSGEAQTDFRCPQNCYLREPQEFVESYTVQEGKQKEQQQGECYRKKIEYANVISSADAGRANNNLGSMNLDARKTSCTKHQTQYVEEGGQVCFTVRPLPVCKSGCRARGTVNKQVLVHCVENSNVSQLWMNEVKKGASPDFSLKAPTKAIKMDVPQGCSL